MTNDPAPSSSDHHFGEKSGGLDAPPTSPGGFGTGSPAFGRPPPLQLKTAVHALAARADMIVSARRNQLEESMRTGAPPMVYHDSSGSRREPAQGGNASGEAQTTSYERPPYIDFSFRGERSARAEAVIGDAKNQSRWFGVG